MPIKRRQYLREADSWTRDGEYREDLPKSGYLTGLLLEVSGSCQSGATLATEGWKLLDFLDKVQIRGNGAEPIISADWKHLQYCVFLDTSKVSPGFWRNYATNTQFEYLFIPFGRFPWDREFGLDLSKWDNVEIILDNTGSSTYYSASLSLDILMCLFDELPGGFSRGYLRKEEYRQWTTVANAWEYTDLPTAYPLRGVHMQLIPDVDSNYISETGMHNLADDVNFAYGGRKTFLHQGGVDHLQALNWYEQPGETWMTGHVDKTADYGFNMEVGRCFGWAGISGSKDGAVSATIPTIEADQTHNTQKLEAREADSPVHIAVRGFSPYNCITFHYSHDANPEDLLTFSRHGQVTLDVHTYNDSTAADGTNTILLDSIVAR